MAGHTPRVDHVCSACIAESPERTITVSQLLSDLASSYGIHTDRDRVAELADVFFPTEVSRNTQGHRLYRREHAETVSALFALSDRLGVSIGPLTRLVGDAARVEQLLSLIEARRARDESADPMAMAS